MTPADLLQWLSFSRKTGTLVVRGGLVEKKVFLKDGRVISSASNDPREYLGQFLMSHGFISEPELKKAMEVQQQSKILLGKILVVINAISEKDLIRLMRLKAEEEIYDIFLWKEGEFHFIDDELPKMEMIALQVDVTGIIMEGTRRSDEWARIKELVPSRHLVPVVEKAIDQSSLSEVQKTIVQAVNGHRSIEEIILESRSSDFTVSKTIFDFVKTDMIKLIERAGSPPPTPRELPQPLEEAPIAQPEIDLEADEVTSLLTRAQTALKEGDFDKAIRLLKAAQNLDPNSVKVRGANKAAETVISTELRKKGIGEARIPQLTKTFDEISSMNFSPNEGFILSRINGMWDIGSIVKISPMRETDALLIFNKLLNDQVIDFKA